MVTTKKITEKIYSEGNEEGIKMVRYKNSIKHKIRQYWSK